jgi:hypothetical protein
VLWPLELMEKLTMRWRIWLLMLLNSKAVFFLPHIHSDAGEFDSVGQTPVMSSDLPRYPTESSGP